MSIADSLKQRLSRPDRRADPANAFGAGDTDPAPVRERRTGSDFSRRAGSFLSDLRNRISGGEDPSFDDPYYDPDREDAARQGYDPAFAPEPRGYDPYGQGYEPYQPPAYTDYAGEQPPPDYDEEAYIPPVQENYDYSYYAAPQPPDPMSGDPAAYGMPPQSQGGPEWPDPAASQPSAPAYPPAGNGYAYGEPDPGEAAFYGGYAPRDAYGDYVPENAWAQPPGGGRPTGGSMPRQAQVRPMKPKKAVTARDVGYYFWSLGIVTGMLLTVAAFIYGCVA